MKKSFLFPLIAGAFLVTSCTQKLETKITGAFDEFLPDDSLLVRVDRQTDTIPAHNGLFTYIYNGDQAKVISLYKYPKKNPDGSLISAMLTSLNVVVFPNTTVTIKGNFDYPQIAGGKFYDEYNKMIAPIEKLKNEYKKANQAFYQRNREIELTQEDKRAFQKVQADKMTQIRGEVEKYVIENPNSIVSLYLLSTYHLTNGEKYLEAFNEDMKKGETKEMYDNLKLYYEAKATRKMAAQRIKVGKEAPNFTMKDVQGKEFTLSSLRGKYVVLDFWGTWCGWCMKGMPAMKKMYETYKDRLEIVGVACKDKENEWKKAIEENQMTWTNLLNTAEGSTAINNIYNVSMFPSKIVISPEGIILHIQVGESEDFYKKIDEYMK